MFICSLCKHIQLFTESTSRTMKNLQFVHGVVEDDKDFDLVVVLIAPAAWAWLPFRSAVQF